MLLGLVRALHIACTGLVKNVDIDTIKIVNNLHFFEKYPLVKESFFLILDYIKKRIDFIRQKKTFETKGVLSYVLYGFPWAFMVFDYKPLKQFIIYFNSSMVSIVYLLSVLCFCFFF